MSGSYFSTTYAQARRRFTKAAAAAGATITSYKIDAAEQDELAIDVAILGEKNAPSIVLSSGIHGVEGFFGSAVQLAWLERLSRAAAPANVRYVLIHGLNPFGFARLRRFNEDNVDLNRNFLTNAEEYAGAPEGYVDLNDFLNPKSPPSRFEPFTLKALWTIWRQGLQPLKESIAAGQYEYPRGLFFGGHRPAQSTRIVQQNCDTWLASSDRIIHVDFHTGLGRFGNYTLLLNEDPESDAYAWYADTFGDDAVEPLADPRGTAYKVTGLFGDWMQKHFSARDYRFVEAEFGTYNVIRVLGAIRTENRAYHFGSEERANFQAAKKELLECFCPNDPAWRSQALEAGLDIIEQGIRAF